MTKLKRNIAKAETFDQLFEHVCLIADYFELFKSCTKVVSRDVVITNASRALDNEDFIAFLKLCYNHIVEISEQCKDLKKLPDEPFTY